MSDTPRTDQEARDWDDGFSMPSDLIALARDLERENAALRRDSDRLNWLITKGPVEVLVTLSSDPVVARKNIDKEMEFPTV